MTESYFSGACVLHQQPSCPSYIQFCVYLIFCELLLTLAYVSVEVYITRDWVENFSHCYYMQEQDF